MPLPYHVFRDVFSDMNVDVFRGDMHMDVHKGAVNC